MKLDEVLRLTRDIPYMEEPQKKELYWFVMEQKPRRILELGFCHGVSACVMAAALQERGEGHIDTVDLLKSKAWQDEIMSIEQLSARCGLQEYMSVHRETTCYTWWLKKRLQEKTDHPEMWQGYDFVFLDGAHTWNIDAAAFFMAERLMRNGGWILFDDLHYNYKAYFDRTGSDNRYGVPKSELAPDEIAEPHVKLIFELLVKTHPNIAAYGYSKGGTWGWAQKRRFAKDTMARPRLPDQTLKGAVSAARARIGQALRG